MISALVAGSAWMKPPTEGAAAALTGAVAWMEAPTALPAAPPAAPIDTCAVVVPPPLPLDPELPPDEDPMRASTANEARSTCASRVASAFFR